VALAKTQRHQGRGVLILGADQARRKIVPAQCPWPEVGGGLLPFAGNCGILLVFVETKKASRLPPSPRQ